jgi:hypothetical protein
LADNRRFVQVADHDVCLCLNNRHHHGVASICTVEATYQSQHIGPNRFLGEEPNGQGPWCDPEMNGASVTADEPHRLKEYHRPRLVLNRYSGSVSLMSLSRTCEDGSTALGRVCLVMSRLELCKRFRFLDVIKPDIRDREYRSWTSMPGDVEVGTVQTVQSP